MRNGRKHRDSDNRRKQRKGAYVLTKSLTLSQTSPGFHVSAGKVLKTLWGKEKLLVTSNFSFSYSVFYPNAKLSVIFIEFKIVVCKLYLEESRICRLGKG